MGHYPGATTLGLPAGGRCDNYLDLLDQKGAGTNQMSEIQAVGDGAGMLTSVSPRPDPGIPTGVVLCQNYPNPFNPSTFIRFSLPAAENVTMRVFSATGQEVETLVQGTLPAGIHEVRWAPAGIASGAYFCELRAGASVDRRKMIYQR
jgi:hypothetical protein